jgi:3-oxoacid CoA-transferase subunit A
MIENYFVTGDKHGNFLSILQTDIVRNPNNAIIILGDAGFNFRLNQIDDRLKKEVSQNSSCVWYCVRGNHCARPQDTSCGYELIYDQNVRGEVYVQKEYPNIRFFKDWGEYYIGRYRVAIIGGAYSVDKWWRLARVGVQSKTDWNYNNPKKTGWFPDEQLTEKEMKAAEKELANNYYDFVFTHTCPIEWQPTDLFLGSVDQSTVDNTMELWLSEVKDVIGWGVWLFGHYHGDRLERPHVEMYYNDIESLDTVYKRWKKYDDTGELNWYLAKSPKFYTS